jgi:P27 family predicted phage terminase small subunit
MQPPNRHKAPSNLSEEACNRWRKIIEEYEIEDAGSLDILHTGLEAFDLMRKAQAEIETDGLTFLDRFKQRKAHPLITTERDARSAYLAALKQLGLSNEIGGNASPGTPAVPIIRDTTGDLFTK